MLASSSVISSACCNVFMNVTNEETSVFLEHAVQASLVDYLGACFHRTTQRASPTDCNKSSLHQMPLSCEREQSHILVTFAAWYFGSRTVNARACSYHPPEAGHVGVGVEVCGVRWEGGPNVVEDKFSTKHRIYSKSHTCYCHILR